MLPIFTLSKNDLKSAHRVSVSLLTFTPGVALVELHRDGELVALAGLHLAVDAEAGARFGRLVKRTIPN